jgi:hypothetical protein
MLRCGSSAGIVREELHSRRTGRGGFFCRAFPETIRRVKKP